MDNHLRYNKYDRSSDVYNYRNGTKSKRVRSKYGELDIGVLSFLQMSGWYLHFYAFYSYKSEFVDYFFSKSR